MRWSKIKQDMEALLAESLSGRIAFHATRYHEAHDSEGRGWMTLDGKEIVNFCTLSAWNREYEIESFCDSAHHGARLVRRSEGCYTLPEYQNVLREYTKTSIDRALVSDEPLIRALAMLDRRLGKRRLQKLAYVPTSHRLVRQFLELRLEAEGLSPPRTTAREPITL